MDKAYVTYEYLQLPVNRKDLHLLLDCYESLGWEQDTRLEGGKELTLRRSRKLVNHMELTRLQGHLESCLVQMDALEAGKGSKATSVSIALGVLGTVLVALSVFAVTAVSPQILLCILFGIPGIALWTLAPVVHKRIYTKSAAAASQLILEKREEIFQICEKGSKLL